MRVKKYITFDSARRDTARSFVGTKYLSMQFGIFVIFLVSSCLDSHPYQSYGQFRKTKLVKAGSGSISNATDPS